MSLGGFDSTLLAMRARDTGFDLGPDEDNEWLCFHATANLAVLWLTIHDGVRIAALAPASLVAEIGPILGVTPYIGTLPMEAAAAWQCHDEQSLDRLCRRAAILGQVLPDQVLHRFEDAVEQAMTAADLGATERLSQVRQRVGQDQFRDALLCYWGGRCPLTGCGELALLRASHAKPWKDCVSDRERLDVHNGLLLAAHLDAAFDAGLITVAPDGGIEVSDQLGAIECAMLRLTEPTRIDGLTKWHRPYLAWHREKVFGR